MKETEGAIAFIDYLQQEDTSRQLMEKLNLIPAHPVETSGLDVSDLFKQVLSDLSEQGQAESFGYNIDVLAPANFNEAMFSGFQQVLDALDQFGEPLRGGVRVPPAGLRLAALQGTPHAGW